MQLSEMRYITGIITQGAGRVAGYCLAEPTGEIKQPDFVMEKDIATYLKNNNCKIINAVVDSMGQVTFRSKADQESYVSLNSSGYVLGWPKRPLPKLHEGNKTGGKTGEMLRPTHSYIVVDINETENVVKVMNLGGMVKPMTLSKLKSAVAEGLIVSNVEVKDGNIKLLSAGMDELTIGKPATKAPVSITPTTAQTTTTSSAIPPVTMNSTPVKPVIPPVAPIKTATTPIKPPVSAPLAPPTGSKAVIPPVVPAKPVTQTTSQPAQTTPVQAALAGNQTNITPINKTQQSFELDFKKMAENLYDFEKQFVKDYSGQKVKIRLDLCDFASEQFDVLKIDGKYYLTFVTNGTGKHDHPYFTNYIGNAYEAFLNLFNDSDTRGCLRDTKIELYFDNRLINGFDYRMLYMERGFLNFAYIIDWSKMDLFRLAEELDYMPKYVSAHVSLLYMPNKILNVQANTLSDTNKLYGKFYAHYQKVWHALVYMDKLNENAREENLVIRIHPRAKISEMTENCLAVMFDYPFGRHNDAKKCVIDLTGTNIRFIAKNAFRLMHGADYELYVPASCKRLHNGAIDVLSKVPVSCYKLDSCGDYYVNLPYTGHAECTNISRATTITVHGTDVERIDNVGTPYKTDDYSKTQRAFIRMADWTPILNLTETTVAIEDLPRKEKSIDVAPYCYPNEDTHIIDNWYTLGDWSETGKGKLSVKLCSKPRELREPINLLISGTTTKAKLELYSEKEDTGYYWPVIEHLLVEEGVTELEIIAMTRKYKFRRSYVEGYIRNYIKHLILPASLKSLSLKLTLRSHSKYVRHIHIAENSIMARLDLDDQLKKWCITPVSIEKYASEKIQHDKNMLSDLIGSDLTNIAIVEFNNESVKANLALCGINI